MGSIDKPVLDIRRFVGFNLLALALAFGANFLGCTSLLLSATNPTYFQSLGLDRLYPINGYMRHVDEEDKYSYVYKQGWVFDNSIALAEAQARELPRSIRERTLRSSRLLPDSAYFDPLKSRANGRGINLSVIKSSVMPGFTLGGTLGTPTDAATKLLATVIAPPGSGKQATLVKASEDKTKNQYIFEYTVTKDSNTGASSDFFMHSISVIAYRGTELYTLTTVCPDSDWTEDEQTAANTIAKSFELEQTASVAGFY